MIAPAVRGHRATDRPLMMDVTPISLLEQISGTAPGPAWDRFVLLYTPLLYLWAGRLGVTGADADDLVQDVYATLVETLPGFRYDPGRRFRGWLWAVIRNKVRERARRPAIPVAVGLDADGLPAAADTADEVAEREYRDYLTRRALELIRADFEPLTWRAFWETTALDRPAAAVAAELGVSPNTVYLAKGRVLRRLRAELEGLLD